MKTTTKRLSFKGQKIYIGIAVHKKSWTVTVLSDSGYRKRFSQPPSARALLSFLEEHLPEGEYHAVYESGFTGFSTYYALEECGIHCIVAHAADVPSGQKEKITKTDAVDSMKLARELSKGNLKGIHMRKKESLDDRSLLRVRKAIQKNLCGHLSRVKHLLYTNGVEYPEYFRKSTTHWSGNFMGWLREEVALLFPTKESLLSLLDTVASLRERLLAVTAKIRRLSRTPRYAQRCTQLCSIPGFGMLSAMTFLVEIEDFSRFTSERDFAGYLGLVPMCHDSSEKTSSREMTFRGNHYLSSILVEASWKAVTLDRAISLYFAEKCKTMKRNKAIIRVARKMSNRILSMMKSGENYKYDRL